MTLAEELELRWQWKALKSTSSLIIALKGRIEMMRWCQVCGKKYQNKNKYEQTVREHIIHMHRQLNSVNSCVCRVNCITPPPVRGENSALEIFIYIYIIYKGVFSFFLAIILRVHHRLNTEKENSALLWNSLMMQGWRLSPPSVAMGMAFEQAGCCFWG